MLIALGMGSVMGFATVIVEVACSRIENVRRPIITAIVLFICFLFSSVYITPGGQHILDLVDFFVANFVLILLGLLESISSKFWRLCVFQ